MAEKVEQEIQREQDRVERLHLETLCQFCGARPVVVLNPQPTCANCGDALNEFNASLRRVALMPPEPVDKHGYPLGPRALGKDAWFYEEPRGLVVCSQEVGSGRVTHVLIPWSKIEAAVARREMMRVRKAK